MIAVGQGYGDGISKNWASCAMEFLSSLYPSAIIPQAFHKLLKRYIRAKKLDSPDGNSVPNRPVRPSWVRTKTDDVLSSRPVLQANCPTLQSGGRRRPPSPTVPAYTSSCNVLVSRESKPCSPKQNRDKNSNNDPGRITQFPPSQAGHMKI